MIVISNTLIDGLKDRIANAVSSNQSIGMIIPSNNYSDLICSLFDFINSKPDSLWVYLAITKPFNSIIEDYSISSRGEILTIHSNQENINTNEYRFLFESIIEKVKDTLDRVSTVPWGTDVYILPSLLRLDPEVFPTAPTEIQRLSLSLPRTSPSGKINIDMISYSEMISELDKPVKPKNARRSNVSPRDFENFIYLILGGTNGLEIEQQYRTNTGHSFDFMVKVKKDDLKWVGDAFPVEVMHPGFNPRAMNVAWFLHMVKKEGYRLGVFVAWPPARQLVQEMVEMSQEDYGVTLAILDNDDLRKIESKKDFMVILWENLSGHT